MIAPFDVGKVKIVQTLLPAYTKYYNVLGFALDVDETFVYVQIYGFSAGPWLGWALVKKGDG